MGSSGKVVMSVLVPAGSPPKPKVAWCVPTANASLGFPAAPAVTTTDGTNNAIVWFIDGTKLMGVDGDTGATIYAGTDSCTRRPQVDGADRGQGADRRRRRRTPLRLVARPDPPRGRKVAVALEARPFAR